jgi:DNA topoisomerase III
MKLFICEKPSQARDIAKHLGARQPGQGCLTGGGVTVTWCIGHLLEQAAPEHYQPELKTWNLALLPVLPKQWAMNVKSSVRDQFKAVSSLVKQATAVVIATDADREGEVIAREVLQLCGYRGPISRLWLSALDDASVKAALNALLPGAKTHPMYLSGLGRSRADWLAGMNLTMALTKAFGTGGKGAVLHCGRVQTPVLGLIVRREKAIAAFKPKPYFTLDVVFEMLGTAVPMTWTAPESVLDGEGHVVDRSYLDAVASSVKAKTGRVADVKQTPERELAPLLYSLGSLQRDASRLFGLKAQAVLDACQALYEKHKATSYPRTDCEYLPVSMFGDTRQVLDAMANCTSGLKTLVNAAKLTDMPRVFNDKKITAHHAIIPTANSTVRTIDMSSTELKVYNLICARYIAQFLGAFEFTKTVLTVVCESEKFTQTGTTPKVIGWRAAGQHFGLADAKKHKASDDDNEQVEPVMMPSVKVGDQAINRKAEVQKKQTSPPKRYTEGTLLGAMESIDREIDDPRLKKIMQTKEKAGIGTDATRSAIIEGLFRREYIVTERKYLVPTQKGIGLIETIERFEPSLVDPVLTALWEEKLAQIEAGKISLEEFEAVLGNWLTSLIVKIRSKATNTSSVVATPSSAARVSAVRVSAVRVSAASNTKYICPSCGKVLMQRAGGRGPFWGCSAYPACRVTLPDVAGKPGARSAPGGVPAKGTPLVVRFEDKEKVKSLGAKWDGNVRSWVVPNGISLEPFRAWLPTAH